MDCKLRVTFAVNVLKLKVSIKIFTVATNWLQN